ncbi:hypothetical protein ASAC_0745 [Acidilobus saccharovorans 345-15]|uniref:DUF973 family protein n=1 Tax=Acidilobus saccharovorans (strain DSM 16705 / JCM 18335 / VKM B-2471 / 345-15) TaxID=666510 RepID=D9Q1G3_ACIS3|nr:DUF973 family protein [Acidilobus saccharovorans]ADL19151.1 hypothetical protein ASAC_0745 [Acidilobus saccharovorans 345-15]
MSNSGELEGVGDLKRGLIYIFISDLLSSVFYVSGFITHSASPIVEVVSLLIGLVLAVMALMNLRRGFTTLSSMGKGGSLGASGVMLIVVGLAIALLGILLMFIVLLGGAAVAIMGLVIIIVGFVMIGVGFYSVGSAYNNSTLKIGGILTALFFVPFLPLVGLILDYVGLGEVEGQLRASQASQPGAAPTVSPPTL